MISARQRKSTGKAARKLVLLAMKAAEQAHKVFGWLQVESKSEAVAAAWQMLEAQKADLASQQGKLAQRTNHLEEQTR